MPAKLPPGREPARMRSVRVPDVVWDGATARARDVDGVYLSTATVELLARYAAGEIVLTRVDPESLVRKSTVKKAAPRKKTTAKRTARK